MKKTIFKRVFAFLCTLAMVMTSIISNPANANAETVTTLKNVTVVCYGEKDENGNAIALDGTKVSIQLCNDQLDSGVVIASETTTGTNTCDVYYNGDKFVHTNDEGVTSEYTYLRTVHNAPADSIYQGTNVINCYTVADLSEDTVTLYVPVKKGPVEVVRAVTEDYVVYAFYLDGGETYRDTSVSYYYEEAYSDEILLEALSKLTEEDTVVYVDICGATGNLPTPSAAAMQKMASIEAALHMSIEETGEKYDCEKVEYTEPSEPEEEPMFPTGEYTLGTVTVKQGEVFALSNANIDKLISQEVVDLNGGLQKLYFDDSVIIDANYVSKTLYYGMYNAATMELVHEGYWTAEESLAFFNTAVDGKWYYEGVEVVPVEEGEGLAYYNIRADKIGTTNVVISNYQIGESTIKLTIPLQIVPASTGENVPVVQTDVFTNGGKMKVTTPEGSVVEVERIGNSFPIGSTLRECGYSFGDPTHDTWTFLGWSAFENGELSPNMTRIEGIPMLTTEQLLDFELTDTSIMFMAQWKTSESGQPGGFGSDLNFFLYGGGGRFDYKYKDAEEMKTAKGAGLFTYSIDNDKAFKQCMDERGDGLVNIYKQCGTLKGWELYTCDHVEFFNVPTGEKVVISDDVTLNLLMQLGGRDYYVIMKNPVKADSLKTTDEIYNLTGTHDYFATLVWEEAHNPTTATENKVAATDTTEGSYDKVVYCVDCGVEISRTKETIPMTVKPGTVTNEQITGTIIKVDEILSGSASASEKKDAIVISVDRTVIKEAMVTQPEFQNNIKAFEDEYVDELQITVDPTTVDEKVKDVVKADSIVVVGAGLNGANVNDHVNLKVAEVTTPKNVGNNYKNAIQVDIQLLVNNTSKEELEVPIVITMDVPAGVDAKNLVILHYHGDTTTPEVITPEVNGNKITFAVDKFSTFVFANEISHSNNDSNNGGSNSVLVDSVVKSPKTGDNSVAPFIALLVTMFAIALATVAVYRRKTVR